MRDMDHMDDTEVTSEKVLHLENDVKVTLRRTDPYGFIVIKTSKGRVPDFLAGLFTSYHEAEKKVDAWLKEKALVIKEKHSSLDEVKA